MHILFLTDYLPYPPISGDLIRVYHLIRRLAQTHQVSVAAPVRTPEEAQSVEAMREFCKHVITADLPRRNPVAHLPGLARTALAGYPLELHFLTSKTLINRINTFMESNPVDIIQFEHSRMAHYAEALSKTAKTKKALTFHNVASQQFDTIYKVTRPLVPKFRAWLFSRQMRKWESHCVRTFDRCITVSGNDRQILLADTPGSRIDVVPNGVDTHACQILPRADDQPTLLMVGLMSYAPYTDSAIYFCETILPILQKKIGTVRVLIVGPNPPPEVKRFESDYVQVTGRVPEVAPYYRQSTISVVPLRAGGGTRLKILEAMAFGRPVVSTSLGCEGLNVISGENILIADEPELFANSIVRLMRDSLLYSHIVTQARMLVEVQYDWNVIAAQMLKIYGELAVTQ